MTSVRSSPEPSIRQALGQSTTENRPFARPLTKKQSQKFGATPSKGCFTPRSSRFNPSSRPSTPSSARQGSRFGGAGEEASSPVPELDNLNRATTTHAWVHLQIKALSRYAPPDPSLLLPDASSPPTSKDTNTWISWVDSVETKLERMQVVELPRLVAAAKGPSLEIDTLDVVLSILPLLKTLRTRLAARRDWLELLRLSSDWRADRLAAEARLGSDGQAAWGFSSDLLALALTADRIRLVVRSANELRACLSTHQLDLLSSGVLGAMDKAWWDLKGKSVMGSVPMMTVLDGEENYDCEGPRATDSSLLFPSNSVPDLSPSGTSSSLDQTSTASESTSCHTLSPSTSDVAIPGMTSKASLPHIVGYQGSDEQKRAWFKLSKDACTRAQEAPFAPLCVSNEDADETPSASDL